MENFSYIEIDDGDPEHTHLWVSVNDTNGCMIELIDQYVLEDRLRAYSVAWRLSDLLKLPMKLKTSPFEDPRPIDRAELAKRA